MGNLANLTWLELGNNHRSGCVPKRFARRNWIDFNVGLLPFSP